MPDWLFIPGQWFLCLFARTIASLWWTLDQVWLLVAAVVYYLRWWLEQSLLQTLLTALFGRLQHEAIEVRLADVAVIDQARDVDAGVVDHGDVVRGNARVADADRGGDDHDQQHECRAEDDRQIPLREETALHRGGSITVIT